jgi:hypothetical protein
MTTSAKPESPLRLISPESEVYDLMRAPITTAERVKRLQAEAKALAAEQVDQLEATLLSAAALASEIANGGDAYAIGARELAARLSEELTAKAETLEAIMSRVNR